MKTLIRLLIACVLFTSCDGFSLFQKKITIKGKISTSSKSSAQRAKSSTPTLADAAKVLVFYGNEYDLVNISSGSFTSQAPAGSAACLVFLDANNKFIGNLFAGGINVLPLVNMGNTSSIDLSTLTLDGTRVIPANDPIGSTIQLTSQELDFLTNVGAYYQTLSKNIDMDNDNSPDIIDGDQIRVNTIINMRVGSFGTDSKQLVMVTPDKFVVNTNLRIAGGIKMWDKNFTVSLASPVLQSTINLSQAQDTNPGLGITEFIYILHQNAPQGSQNPLDGQLLPFPDGVYTFQLNKDRQYTFNFANINMQNYMMIIKPIVHTDKDGYITKISYEFVFPDGTTANPRNLIQGYIRTQIGDHSYNQLYEGHHLYGTFSAGENYDYYNEAIGTKIKLSDVTQCNFAFIDILGNEYEYSWVDDLSKYQN